MYLPFVRPSVGAFKIKSVPMRDEKYHRKKKDQINHATPPPTNPGGKSSLRLHWVLAFFLSPQKRKKEYLAKRFISLSLWGETTISSHQLIDYRYHTCIIPKSIPFLACTCCIWSCWWSKTLSLGSYDSVEQGRTRRIIRLALSPARHLLVTYCHPIQYPSTETDGLVQRTFEIIIMMRWR